MESSTTSSHFKRRRQSKRQCRLVPSIDDQFTVSCFPNDCYSEVFKYTNGLFGKENGNSVSDTDFVNNCVNSESRLIEHNANSESMIRSSWLIKLKWISSHDYPQEQSEENKTGSKTSVATGIYYENSLPMEIKCIHQQLVQVKRRLGPAAERCAMLEVSHPDSTKVSHHLTAIAHTNRLRCIFEGARRFCNPYEILGEGQNFGLNQYLFMNRSAIKLANIDALIGFCLTNLPSSELHGRRTFKFCDLCGAPGGFSEYVLWRLCHPTIPTTASQCRGYGMSLFGMNEHGRGISWKLQNRNAQEHVFYHNGIGEMCQQYKICCGVDGTGDIHNWENVICLQQTIYNDDVALSNFGESGTEFGKVHLVLADGGFDAQRDVENQEEVAQKLVACEAAAALSLLSTGGTMVLTLFGFQTAVVRSMIRHFYFTFDNIIALKPISSRPASTERYIVCIGFHGNPFGWTGLRWSSDLYLGRPCTVSRYTSDSNYSKKEAKLLRYLDEFDRDVCALNLKANFAILTYMERNCFSLDQGRYSDTNEDPEYEIPRINIPLFRIAWRLAC